MSKEATFAADAQPQGSGTFQYFNVADIDIDPATNGRFEGHDENETRTLALDILSASKIVRGRMWHGQIAPVTISRMTDGTPILVAGFGRCGAIDYINANTDDAEIASHLSRLGLLNADGALEKPFPVKAFLAPAMTTEELEDLNMAENADRKDLSPMDWAIHIGRLAKRGMDDKAIAAHISKYIPNGRASISHNWVAKHRYLLMMSPETQRAIHRREIPIDRAVEMWRNARDITVADPTADDGARKPTTEEVHKAMDEQIGAVKDPETGKIDTAKLREENRQKNAQRGSKATLTIAEFVKILEKGIAAKSAAAETIFAAVKGKITEAEFLSWLADSAPAAAVKGSSEKPMPAEKTRRGGSRAGKAKAGTQVDLEAVQTAVKGSEKPAPATTPEGVRLPPPRAGGKGRKPSGSKTAEAPAAADASAAE